MRIAVANQSTLCTDGEVAQWCQAITRQLAEVAQHWGRLPVAIAFFADKASPPAGYDTILILDDADQAGDLGWHASATGSFPFGRVFARPSIDNGVTVSSVLSHEVLELFVDPFVGLWASDMGSPGKMYALEVGDPVEGDSYEVDGVTVSNYAYPAWFDATDQTGPWDRMGTTKGPFQIAPHGYVVYTDAGGVHTVFGETYPDWRKATKESPAARTAKRRSHHRDHGSAPWWAEELLHGVCRLQEDMVMLMSDQAHLDADVQALTAGLQALADASSAIEAEIAALKQQNPSLDMSALDSKVSDLSTAVARLQGDAPAAPPVTPPTEPTPGV